MEGRKRSLSSESASSSESSALMSSPKQPRLDSASEYSSVAARMMSRMGYEEGTGLGKHKQGIVEPVKASSQRGRRGLGLSLRGLDDAQVVWKPEQEQVSVEECVHWIPVAQLSPPRMKELRSWRREGERKLSIENEVEFCDEELLRAVLGAKSVFDQMERDEMFKARTRSNPYETIRSGPFLNRAAMKMANIEAVFDFMFTQPRTLDGRPVLSSDELLYFADVCAGPGGFSEYVFYRKHWRAKGFGFTLKGDNDFKLENFFSGPPESFELHYGVGGFDGDGDVFKEANIRAFEKHVLRHTDNKGVHFMMADGGFSVEGQENLQEILSKQLYLCQILVALGIVRVGGHFVCKLFDLFTPFSIGLVYLMHRCFHQVSIHKPHTSRPANSERYIICKYKREDTKDVHDYLFETNCRLNQLGFGLDGSTQSETDILELVPMEILKSDNDFFEYMCNSNNELAKRQIANLSKIVAFYQDQNLIEPRQGEMRMECLKYWQIPNEPRKAPRPERPDAVAVELLDSNLQPVLSSLPTVKILTTECIEGDIRSTYDFKFVWLANPASNLSFFLGLGRSKVFEWQPKTTRWARVDESTWRLELPRGTLIVGEVVQELMGEGMAQRRVNALHVVDAAFVGGEDVRQCDLKTRIHRLSQLVKAVDKPSRKDQMRIRVKDLYGLEKLPEALAELVTRPLKRGRARRVVDLDLDREQKRFFCPEGVLMMRIVMPPFLIAVSKRSGQKYWYNCDTRKSDYSCPHGAFVDFLQGMNSRFAWTMEGGGQYEMNGGDASQRLSEADLCRVIAQKCNI